MKRTDEMKLGEELRSFSVSKLPGQIDPYCVSWGEPVPDSDPPIERFNLAAQLQLMKALAILGWAAFILELLRV